MTAVLAFIGRNTLDLVRYLSGLYDLSAQAAYWTLVAPFKGRSIKWKSAVHQIVLTGVNSIPIVSLISLFIGRSASSVLRPRRTGSRPLEIRAESPHNPPTFLAGTCQGERVED